ncbi:MAG: hypothetical protein AAF328_12100, partial [Planctomycetota bacterium]
MPDARHIAQRIAGWLRSGSVPSDDQAAATAEAYAMLTRRAGERLNRCAALLAQGLRTEAVQEADAEPDLLGQIAALELPDPAAWGDTCRRQGWPAPDAIRPDVAALLNRAYADESLVEPLLREYRLRCVVRAPVRARLAALRALAGVDRGNRPWHDALLELERARHEEIRTEIDAALGDVEALQELRRELNDDRQKTSPPAELVRRVDAALQDGRIARAQDRLETLLPTLEEAYSAMDFPACSKWLEDWSQTLKAVGRSALHVPATLRQRVEPILDWTQQQAAAQAADLRFREACDQLAEVTASGGSPQALQAAMDEALSYERPLPGTLNADATEALAVRLQQHRRRRLWTWAGAAAAALALAGTLAFWGFDRAARQDVVTRSASVVEAAENNDLALAENRFNALAEDHPDRFEGPAYTAAQTALHQARERELERIAQLEKVQTSLIETAVDAWTPNDVELAESLARTTAETESVAALRARFDRHVHAEATKANEEALAVVVTLRESLNAWDGEAIDSNALEAKRTAESAAQRAERLAADPRLAASTSALLSAVGQ